MPTVSFGLVAGVNLATLSDAGGADNRTGFVGGGFLTWRLTPVVGVQPELLYSQKGATTDV